MSRTATPAGEALAEALISGTGGDAWAEMDGSSSLEFAMPGTLVIRSQETMLIKVLDLLEVYRAALRASKPRDRKTVDPEEVITVYYRLHENVAKDLVTVLPRLVQPESWKDSARPKAQGHIIYAASPADLFSTNERRRSPALPAQRPWGMR